MKASTNQRMIILADRGALEFPMFDFAHQVGGDWVSVSTGKTVAQMNSEATAAFWHELATKGHTEQRTVRLVTHRHGERLCRAHDKATA